MKLYMRFKPAEKECKIKRDCPYCNGVGRIHARGKRILKDVFGVMKTVDVIRMKCSRCSKTWRLYPEGVTKGLQRTNYVVAINTLLHYLGLSFDAVRIFTNNALLIEQSKTTCYNDYIRSCGAAKRELRKGVKEMRVRIISGDGFYPQIAGEGATPAVCFVDAESEILLEVEFVSEHDLEEIKPVIERVAREVGAQIILTDANRTFSDAARGLKLKNINCYFHFLKEAQRNMRELARECQKKGCTRLAHMCYLVEAILQEDFKEGGFESIVQIIKELGGFERLQEHKRTCARCNRPRDKEHCGIIKRAGRNSLKGKIIRYLNYLLSCEEKLRIQTEEGEISFLTNNSAERVIEFDYKNRSKTMRCFKKVENLKRHMFLSSYIRKNRDELDMEKIIA